MTWLTPIAGLILAAAVIPPLIILYFLKLRRKPQAISCTLLWKRSVEDLRANAPFQKLRRSLLLLLQLIALILLALSIAQPQIHAGSQTSGRTVILIDNSASMTATDPTPGTGAADATRLDEAKRRAKEKIEQLYGGGLFASSSGETMIIVFSDRAEVHSRFTTSKAALLDAIDRIQPTHGETKIAEALKLANAYTTNVLDEKGEPRLIADPPTLEIYSDGRIADLESQTVRGETFYHAIGSTDADNVAISAISVERPYDRPSAAQVFIALLNFNKEPVKCDMQVSVDQRVVGIQSADVPAAELVEATKQLLPGRANVVFTPFEQPRDAVIQVANLREDKLAADNVAQVVVPPPKRLKVALVTPGRSLIKTALEGMTFELLQEISADRYEKLALGGEGGLDTYDVIVLDNYQPKVMPPARYLTFGPTPPIEGLNEYGDGKQQVILSTAEDHPVLRYVNHDNVFISKFKLLQPGSDVQLLWEGSSGPAIVALSRGSMHLIHVTFDPLDSNWPFQRGFVTFLFNAVEFLGNAGEAIATRGFAPGEAISTRLPASATDIRITVPDRTDSELLTPQDPTQLAWGPIRLSGVYRLNWKTPDSSTAHSRFFAVNLLSEAEGRLDVAPSMEIGQDTVSGRRSDEAAYTPLWPWAIGVCLAVLMLEWWVYHRKAFI